MSEEQILRIRTFLSSAIEDEQLANDWEPSDPDPDSLVPLLQSLNRYLGREFLDEEEDPSDFDEFYLNE